MDTTAIPPSPSVPAPFTLPATSVALNDASSPADVLDALFLGPFLAGEQPTARSRTVDHVKAGAPLVPAGSAGVRRAVVGRQSTHLAWGAGWTLLGSRWGDGPAYLTVTALTDDLAEQVLDAAVLDATEPAPEDEPVVAVGFWSSGARGPTRTERRIAAEPWDAIRRNYTGPVAAAFERLLDLRPGAVGGRLLLLHGPPGTGKTTALRALAHGWRDWCDLEYVLDPERLLRDPGYLVQAASGEDEERWRLLVLEDCDELIRADAKSETGQSLARLLNLTDGILGQGLDVLVAITTNEPLSRLHPAIVRPGRCLAQVEVGPLTAAECRRWLGGPVVSPIAGMTIAELYARSSGAAPIETEAQAASSVGYL